MTSEYFQPLHKLQHFTGGQMWLCKCRSPVACEDVPRRLTKEKGPPDAQGGILPQEHNTATLRQLHPTTVCVVCVSPAFVCVFESVKINSVAFFFFFFPWMEAI